MPNSLNAAKRHRQSLTARMRNRAERSHIRTGIKKFEAALKSGNVDVARGLYLDFVKAMDSAVGKKVYHRNTAARKKSRLYRRISLLASETQA